MIPPVGNRPRIPGGRSDPGHPEPARFRAFMLVRGGALGRIRTCGTRSRRPDDRAFIAVASTDVGQAVAYQWRRPESA